MGDSVSGTYRRSIVVTVALAVTCSAALIGVMLSPALADVSQVRGSAIGFHADEISLFGGSQPDAGPRPQVQLASDASNSPQPANEPSGKVQYGPATIFTSDRLDVSSSGSVGPSGSVTSAADIDNINRSADPDSGSELFSADNVTGTCTASETGTTGSTSITNGSVRTHAQAEGHDEGVVQVPANPPPNYRIAGHIHLDQNTTDYFVIVFNEQVTNPDGSITINAAHEYFGATLDGQGNIQDHPGSILQGHLYIGQVQCGVTVTQGATTTTVPGATTTVPGATTTTTTVPAATTTTTTQPSGGNGGGTPPPGSGTPPGTNPGPPSQPPPDGDPGEASGAQGLQQVTGSAYGYWTEVSLFGGPSSQRGPAPEVTLAPDASNNPQDASVNEAEAIYGPAVIFRSGRIEVHTEGAVGTDARVASSSKVRGHPSRGERPGPLLFDSIESTCNADGSGVSATVTVGNGVVETQYDEQTQEPTKTQDVPANPPPGYTVEGTLDHVGDRFRVVFNEQQETADGVTVNAVHMYLLGPIAKGDLVIGQARCILGAAAGAAGSAVAGAVGGAAGAGAGVGANLANTGSNLVPSLGAALGLVAAGAGLLVRGSMAARRRELASSDAKKGTFRRSARGIARLINFGPGRAELRE